MADKLRFVPSFKVAAAVDVTVQTVARWCRSGRVICRQLPSGKSPWRIAVDESGWPLAPVSNR